MSQRLIFLAWVVALTGFVYLLLNLMHLSRPYPLDSLLMLALALIAALTTCTGFIIGVAFSRLPGDYDPGTIEEQNWR